MAGYAHLCVSQFDPLLLQVGHLIVNFLGQQPVLVSQHASDVLVALTKE